MSDEKNETVADIVAEMRLGVKDWRGERVGIFDHFADRIEAAAKREQEATREKSSQVGNTAKMRDALESVRNWCLNKLGHASYQVTIECLLSIVNSALSVPSRNCDSFSKEKVLEILEDRSFSKEDTIEWLYAEVKGE